MKYAPYRTASELKPTKKTSFPRRIAFIDTETKPHKLTNKSWENRFYLGCLIFVELDNNANIKKREIHRFDSVYELLYILAKYSYSKKRLIVFGHNIAFDIEVLNLPFIYADLGCVHTYPIKNAMSFIWRVETGRGNILFLDTANYAVSSLERLGKDIGIPKQKVDFETVNDNELYDYCLNDVMICEQFILQYINFLIENDMGEFKQTIASQALTSFRHRFMNTRPFFHLNDSINEIEKFSYFGGRTEALQIGDIPTNPIYNLDVCSEYPAAMIASKMPYQLIGINHRPIDSAIDYHLDNNYLIVKCDISTDKPVFPMRANIKKNKDTITLSIQTDYATNNPAYKIIYPTGQYTTWLHHSEFEYALKNNLITHVHKYILYRADDLFSDYVNTLFKLKAHYSNLDNRSFRYVSKIFLNSLYGKWGQEFHDTQYICDVDNDNVEVTYGFSQKGGFSYTDIEWFGKLYRTYQTGLATYSFPAIAGAITSNARMILWKYRQIANDDNVYYSDTDSLMTNESGYSNLIPHISPNTLGMLELKGKHHAMRIFGNKDYTLDNESVHKGIPTKNEYVGKWTWEYMNFEGFNIWRNSGANHAPVTSFVTKERKAIYDKGILNNTARITPYVIHSGLSVFLYSLQEFESQYLSLFPDYQKELAQVP